MQLEREARPGLVVSREPERAAKRVAVFSGHHDYSEDCKPVVLEIIKDGRPIRPFKLVPLNGELVLAQAVRNQQGTQDCISVPLVVLDRAEKDGVRWFYWRHDRLMEMRRIKLTDLRNRGQLREDSEIYAPLEFMQRVEWKAWPYATEVIRLGDTVQKSPQLSLFEVA